MTKRRTVVVITALAFGMSLAPLGSSPVHAGSGGPSGQYNDLCVVGYPTGCTEVTGTGPGYWYLYVLDGATDTNTINQIHTFVTQWDYIQTAFWDAGAFAFPYLNISDGAWGCTNYGTAYLDICNGSNPSGDRGLTGANTSGNNQLAGSQSTIDTSQSTSCAQGAVFHELMLALGYMEFENDSDPFGASAANNPLQGACSWNSQDIQTVYSWYNGAGE